MPFLSCQIFFYLTIVCNLARCSFAPNKSDDETHVNMGCRYTYPDYVSPYVMSCRNMYANEIPYHENVTKMELVNVPLAVLNETLVPVAVQSNAVDLRQLHWTKSHIKMLEHIPIASLVELDLSWNIIQDVQSNALQRLASLKKFNISRNNVDRFPANLFDQCRHLTVLSMSHNQLKVLPHGIFDSLSDLEILDVSNNRLSYIEETVFMRNPKLLTLNLSHNKISNLSSNTFHSTSALQSLYLEDNHLFLLETDTFIRLHELMVLNLAKNPLWSLPTLLLPANNTLFILSISHTRLIGSRLSALQNLRWLRSLHLTDNANLQNLHNDTFSNLSNLKTIRLENNNFTQLPPSILDTKPEDVYLDGNPWPCDCSVQWIVYWVRDVGSDQISRLHLTGFCNGSNADLLDSLLEMRCKPTVVRVTPVRYQSLETNVRLVCQAYANPVAEVSWITPNGFVYMESEKQQPRKEDSSSSLRYRPTTLDSYKHLQSIRENVRLHENGELEIVQMTRDDAGEYVCVAYNRVGESFAYTRLYVDPSIMQRIKTGSIICGLLWVNTFLLFSIAYLLIRRYSKRTKQEKRRLLMRENMDVYKTQQIVRLKERCKNQMNRIKNNCAIQVDWMKENYKESISNVQDHRISYLSNQYNDQMTEIRDYYLTQMQKVREYFDQQRNLILKFSVNCVSNDNPKDRFPQDADLIKMENGTANRFVVASTEEEEREIYKYNDTMKNEIQMLTSLRNLRNIFNEINRPTSVQPKAEDKPSTSCHLSKVENTTNVSNGKLRVPDDEGDEKTSMLPCNY